MLVLAINHTGATRRTADLVRRMAPDVRVVARTTYLGEVEPLQQLGVQEIVPQELETSIEIMVRVLRHFLVPAEDVGTEVHRARKNMGLPDRPQRPHESDTHRMADFLPGLKVEIFRVEHGAEIANFSLEDSDLRRLSGCTVVAVGRGNSTDISIRPETVLKEGDVAVLIGPVNRITEAAYLFRAPDTKSSVDVDEADYLVEDSIEIIEE